VNIRPENPNLAQLVAVAAKLEPMLDQIAFVGGCVTGLLLTDPAAAPVGRGRNDFRMSHDLEDTVTVVDGRPEITEEVHRAPAELQKYLGDEFRALLSNRDFLEAAPGHLLPDAASQQRLGLVMNRMQQFLVESY
jgi:hypothetical protein